MKKQINVFQKIMEITDIEFIDEMNHLILKNFINQYYYLKNKKILLIFDEYFNSMNCLFLNYLLSTNNHCFIYKNNEISKIAQEAQNSMKETKIDTFDYLIINCMLYNPNHYIYLEKKNMQILKKINYKEIISICYNLQCFNFKENSKNSILCKKIITNDLLIKNKNI